MLERDLYEHYRLNASQIMKYKNYQAFYEKGDLYVIVPVPHLELEELLEIKQMSDYLQFQKEDRLASFVLTTNEELISNVNNERVVLYKIPRLNRRILLNDGEELSRFHKLGRFYPYPPKSATRLGVWKTLWEKRLDQLENWWTMRIQEIPVNRFEKIFFETFPYYLGLSENAIQYVADCIWEDQRKEAQQGTICHVKYRPQTDSELVIFPTNLIFDHPTRDIAEWIRWKYTNGAGANEITGFLNHYERIIPLSATSWRLLFGRLLFPLPYFEIIEGYYSSTVEKEKERYERRFLKYIEQSEFHEQFLRIFFKNNITSSRKLQIPEVEWLQSF